jgi:hypothetical protein
MGVGHGKVLVLSPDYKGRGLTESISSIPAQRMEWHYPPIICGPPRTIEFSDDDTEEEKYEASNELVLTLNVASHP